MMYCHHMLDITTSPTKNYKIPFLKTLSPCAIESSTPYRPFGSINIDIRGSIALKASKTDSIEDP